jgi:putative membrane protein
MNVVDYEKSPAQFLGAGKAAALIAALSVGIIAFLFWLLYFKPASGRDLLPALPAVNASFNALSTLLLIGGWVAIRNRKIAVHVRFMLSALGSSAMFFVGYVVYHSFHGDTKFAGAGGVRPVYFLVLITHIVLSAVVVPMILTSLYLALSGRLATHKRVARWTLPIWLYVSVTGVVIFVMLKAYNS